MLKSMVYRMLSTREIRPEGWLRAQLLLEANGLAGNLDKVWPDVRESKWVGGDREGWERVPYWLDGFVPLAFLLDDADMQARAKKYIDAILARQQPDGWLCPCAQEERAHYDMWALFLILKVLVLYHDCTQDARIEPAVRRALQSLKAHLRYHTLFGWAATRWFECLIPLFWLYERSPEPWLEHLAATLYAEGTSYKTLFAFWRDQHPVREWTFTRHIVNLSMALKSEALAARLPDSVEEPDAFAEKMFSMLTQYHGMACGHFTGDEVLAGKSPIQGTELCGVVEAMFSYEQLFAHTGAPKWMDRCEALAFNALPATISEDMWSHQYDQMTNQIACRDFWPHTPIFMTNGPQSNMFGLEPNYGCCTANFGQGWPKLALSAFMRSEKGVVSAALVPARCTLTLGDARVSITLDTEYPFRDTLTYIVEADAPVSFELLLRIPASAASASVDGTPCAPGGMFSVERVWSGRSVVRVRLTEQTRLEPRPNNLYCLRRGALLYAVPIAAEARMREYTKDGVERKFPYCDYELIPQSPWTWAFSSDSFTLCETPLDAHPFSHAHPPVALRGKLARVDWGIEPGYEDICRAVPQSRAALGAPEDVLLVPYGCTALRMTELPRATE